jgi:hypothetical protein
MILRLRQACTHAALVLNTFENDDSQTTGGYAEADPNTCYMSVLSSNDAFFLEGKRYFSSKTDQKYFSKYILHEDQGENSDGFSVDLITIQLDNLLCGCLSRDKYGNVLLNKRTELVDDFNIN